MGRGKQLMTRRTSFRIFLAVIFLLCLLSSAAFAVIRIMPLGDSITNGNSSGVIPDDSHYYVSYRKALWNRLVAAGYDVDFVGSLNSGSAVFGSADLADHEGHPGWTDDQIVAGNPLEPGSGKLIEWLLADQPDIILLHIGTNGLESSAADVGDILTVIHNYDPDLWVILARIINRSCLPNDTGCANDRVTTTTFNNNVVAMAQTHLHAARIKIVDMETGAGINYARYPEGDMYDELHPFATGYAKMADVWFDDGLKQILPTANAGPDQSVVEGGRVTLDGSRSTFPAGVTPNYSWTQTGGTLVTLSSLTAVQPSFTAPGVDSVGETLTFTLRVTANGTLEDTATVAVTVNNNSSGSGGGGGGGGCFIATSAQGSPAAERHRVGRAFLSFGVLANTLALAAALRAGLRWNKKDRPTSKDQR